MIPGTLARLRRLGWFSRDATGQPGSNAHDTRTRNRKSAPKIKKLCCCSREAARCFVSVILASTVQYSTVVMLMTPDGPAVIDAKVRCRPKIAIFATVRWVPLEYCHNVWCRKNQNGVATRRWNIIEDTFIRFDRIHKREDGQTDTARRHRPRLCRASRGKNWYRKPARK